MLRTNKNDRQGRKFKQKTDTVMVLVKCASPISALSLHACRVSTLFLFTFEVMLRTRKPENVYSL